MDITAFNISHSVGIDIDATALRVARARSGSIGAMDESSGNSRCKQNRRSGVVMDITAFKVSHPVGVDIDATPLRAARARSSSIGALEDGSKSERT